MNKVTEYTEKHPQPLMTIPETGVSKFFKRSATAQRIYINFEQSKDNLFRAIATGFIDLFLSQKLTAKFNKHYAELFENYFQYFPQLYPKNLLSTKPYDQFQHLINTLHTADLVATLAYAIRQLTVDLLLQDPHLYQDVFAALDVAVTPQQMRNPQQELPRQCIAASALALKVPIHVECYPDAISLPVKISYNYSSQHSFNACEIYIKLTVTPES